MNLAQELIAEYSSLTQPNQRGCTHAHAHTHAQYIKSVYIARREKRRMKFIDTAALRKTCIPSISFINMFQENKKEVFFLHKKKQLSKCPRISLSCQIMHFIFQSFFTLHL